MKKIALAILFSSVTLAGCTSIGTRYANADVDELQPGVSTYSDATAKLGSPARQSVDEKGFKVATWSASTEFLGGTIMPQMVMIKFDKDDKMVAVLRRIK